MNTRYIILALEAFMLFTFCVPLPVVCSGNLLGIIFSLMLMTITAKWTEFSAFIVKLWGKTSGKITIISVSILLIACIVYACVLSVFMYKAMNNKPENPKVIVVLGCKVRGETPTRMLRRRLDTAIDALNKYPHCICIVSGGQGSNEVVSESYAMKKYLVEKGISKDRIIMEDKSTSTFENIKFSYEILDRMGYSRDITIVTDGFHQYRASLIAKKLGGENITAFSADTEARYLPTYWVREWLGLTQYFLFS